MRAAPSVAAGSALLVALSLAVVWPLLSCLDACYVDYFEVFGPVTGNFAEPDARLNSWILAWVHHAAATAPTQLFDGNVFHPEPLALTSSEHLLGIAAQLVPFRLFTGGAVFLHQTALVLSFSLLGLTTFGLARWVTGATAPALVAGAVAMVMPWRHSELMHLQLLSVQWLPLAWLFAARILLADRPRRDAFCLAAALSLQALSSFYLAYFSFLSLALLTPAIAVQAGLDRRRARWLAVGVGIPVALVAATAIPYLARFEAFDVSEIPLHPTPATMWAYIAPDLALRPEAARFDATTYQVPLVVFVLALVALVATPLAARRGGDPRIRIASLALWGVCLGTFAMMLGRELEVLGARIPLPAAWAGAIVPGFSRMRGEFRWAILIGVAAPVLAAAGIAALERLLAGLRKGAPRALARGALWAALLAAIALNVPWFQLPARGAWENGANVRAAHAALAELPPGPVLELPSHVYELSRARQGSLYMLGSTLDWNPLVNGYSGYRPETHAFLQRVARGLPGRAGIARMERLVGLRWVAVHPEALFPWEREAWAIAEREGRVTRASGAENVDIYEIPATPARGAWQADLVSRAPRPTTFAGLARRRLSLPEAPGSLEAKVPAAMHYVRSKGVPSFLTLGVENTSPVAWPGFDLQTEGLVQLRTRFTRMDDGSVSEGTWPLDTDLPPASTTWLEALVRPPAHPGRYRLRLDLVQVLGDEIVPLDVAPSHHRVEVIELTEVPGSASG